MNYLSQKLKYFTNSSVEKMEDNKQRKEDNYNMYFDHMYKLLCWEDPLVTVLAQLIIYLILRVLIFLQVKFFGIFFFSLLVLFILSSTGNSYSAGKEANYVTACRNISMATHYVFFCMQETRLENHSMFSSMMITIFGLLKFLTINMNGFTFTRYIIYGLFTVTFFIHLTPNRIKMTLSDFIMYMTEPRGFLNEDDFIPDKDLRDADLESILTDKTADSVSNSLMSGLGTMPSYMEIQKESDDDDLIPTKPSHDPLSSDSESERELVFDYSHFSTSSDDEKELRPKSDSVDGAPETTSIAAGIGEAITELAQRGGSLIANVFLSHPLPSVGQCEENVSSDSDFEVVDPSDL